MENRYFYSFIITAILYSLFLYGVYSIDFKKRFQKKDKPKIVKISLLDPKPKSKILEKKREITPLAPVPLIKKPKPKIKPKPKPKPKKKITKLKKSKPKKKKVIKRRRSTKKKILKKDKTKIKKKLKKTKRLVKKRVKPKSKLKLKHRKIVKRIKKKAIKPKIDYSYKKRVTRVKKILTPQPTPKRVEPKSYIVEEYIEEYIPLPTPKVLNRRSEKVIETVEEIVEPEIIATPQYKYNHTIVPKRREIKEVINTPLAPQPKRISRDLSGEKRAFLSSLRESINANKIYPKRAKRMGLEGVVRVTFDIDNSGNVLNIRTSSDAPNILRRAVIKAVRDSFPISIPNNLRSQFPLRDISVNIFFKLH